MGLLTKFNFILIPVLALSSYGLSEFMRQNLFNNARDDVMERAGLMMDSAGAVRHYTVNEIRPLLKKQMKKVFLPQTVPAYAATQAFLHLQQDNPEYSYKEATLNPTNPRDRAVDWEADVISLFSNDAELKEFVGERDTPNGRSQFLARPIRITNENCLTCHSIPKAAPKTVVKLYGDSNGFGWKMNEVVGAQIVSVPLQVALDKANLLFTQLMIALAGLSLLVIILLNIFFFLSIIKPLRKMSKIAEKISTGDMDTPEFSTTGNDELAKLSTSFNRMRRSIVNAMQVIEEQS